MIGLGSDKNSLKFKLLAFWKEETPLLTKNAHLENVTKKLSRALPPPSFGKNPKEEQFFLRIPSLIAHLNLLHQQAQMSLLR